MEFKAELIDSVEPGVRITINGRLYLRVSGIGRQDDLVADLETGWLGPWSRMILWDQNVTAAVRWYCPGCDATGALHCNTPEHCGGMKLRKIEC